MSFSSQIKQEITENRIRRQGDALALLSAFTLGIGSLSYSAELRKWGVHFVSESEAAILFAAKLAYQHFGVEFSITRVEHERLSAVYHELLIYGDALEDFLLKIGFMSLDRSGIPCYEMVIPTDNVKTDTQKKAFLRGLFLACGTATEPKKAYHAEFVMRNMKLIEFAGDIIAEFDIKYRVGKRKNNEILYIKEGESLENLLALLGASSAMMEVADLRIVKQASNEANRGVNCINANLERSTRSALKQIDDIRTIADAVGFERLPDPLRAVAEVRLNNSDMTLNEMAEELQLGRSAVNYRLKKLSEMAYEIRSGRY